MSLAWEGWRLGGGQPLLNAVEKSAEGVVVGGAANEGPNGKRLERRTEGPRECIRTG